MTEGEFQSFLTDVEAQIASYRLSQISYQTCLQNIWDLEIATGWIMADVRDRVVGNTVALASLYSKSYTAGSVHIPRSAVQGEDLIFYANTDYDDITFVLSEEWASYLAEVGATAWFTVQYNPKRTVAALDIQLTITDPVTRTLTLVIPAANMTLYSGSYRWQVQVRTPTLADPKKQIAMFGTLEARDTFKL